MSKSKIHECPNCGGTNIKQVGIYYQCQTNRGRKRIQSCGFVGTKEDFNIIEQKTIS